MNISEWLASIPEVLVYLCLGLILVGQSLALPLPGTIALTSAALLAAQGQANPWLVVAAAAIGSAVGYSLGYAIGRRGGDPVLNRLNRRLPRSLSPRNVERARSLMQRWGIWVVLFGRFSALLRMFSGPIAGVLHMPQARFLAASFVGAVIWAGVTTVVVHSLGVLAGPWLDRLSLFGLVAVAFFCVLSLVEVVRGRLSAR